MPIIPGNKAGTGVLQICRAEPNPLGNIEALYVLSGDAAGAHIVSIVAASEHDQPVFTDHKARHLRIFHFNDMHNHFCDLGNNAPDTHRFSQMAKRIENSRRECAEDEAILFISAGDDHTGTGFDDLLGWNVDEFKLDASYRVYSAGGLDLAALGNHEFDRGAKILAHGIRSDASFPLLSANVHSSDHLKAGEDYFPAVIAVVKGLRVGVIGLTTRVETRTGQPDDPGLQIAGPVDVLKNILPALSEICDVIILLSHCGFGDGSHASGKAVMVRDIGEADFSIAKTAATLCDNPMVLIGSHTHTVLNEHGIEKENIIDGVLITQAGCNGRYLGEINMRSGADGVESACLHAIKDAGLETENDYNAEFEQRHIRPIIALVEKNLNSMVGQVRGNELDHATTLENRYMGETALANFMNDGLVERLNATGEPVDLSLLNSASILAGVAQGPLTYRQWFEVMPYSDEVFVVTITGRQIEEILHSNAKRLLRAEEAKTIDLNGFVARGFLHCSSALRYSIDLAGSAAEAKAADIKINGQPVMEVYDKFFYVAVTTYLALGSFGERWNGKVIAGGVAGDLPGYDFRRFPSRNTARVYRNELVGFIRDANTISAKLDGRLKLI